MGGAIGFTLREENGKEHRMCRWTNIMPWAVDNIGIVNKDAKHVSEILKGWHDMVSAIEEGDKEESPMAPCYVPHAGLNPVEYGLVVVDMQKNMILHMNGYHRFASFSSACLELDLMKKGDDFFYSKDGDFARFLPFVNAGRVNELEYYTDKQIVRKPIKLEKDKDVVSYISKKENDYRFQFFILDMSPFKVVRFDETLEGCKQLKSAVEELGFKLTPKEEKNWIEFMRRHDEDQ
jgi:hypothetical protein